MTEDLTASVRELVGELARLDAAIRVTPPFADSPVAGDPGDGATPTGSTLHPEFLDLLAAHLRVAEQLRRRGQSRAATPHPRAERTGPHRPGTQVPTAKAVSW